MRSLERNKQKLWYSLYEGKVAITDGDGNETGDYTYTYSSPVEFSDNISASKGTADTEVFGISLQYTKALTTTDLTLPISETSLIFESLPTTPVSLDDADYTVVRVAKSINSISYALKAVTN